MRCLSIHSQNLETFQGCISWNPMCLCVVHSWEFSHLLLLHKVSCPYYPHRLLAIFCFPDLAPFYCQQLGPSQLIGASSCQVTNQTSLDHPCLQSLSPQCPPWRNRQGEDSWLRWEFSIGIISLWGSQRLCNRNRSTCTRARAHTHTHTHTLAWICH